MRKNQFKLSTIKDLGRSPVWASVPALCFQTQGPEAREVRANSVLQQLLHAEEVGWHCLHLAVAAPAGTGRLQMCSSNCLILFQNPTHPSLLAWLGFLPWEDQLLLGLAHIGIPGVLIVAPAYLALGIEELLLSAGGCFLVIGHCSEGSLCNKHCAHCFECIFPFSISSDPPG